MAVAPVSSHSPHTHGAHTEAHSPAETADATFVHPPVPERAALDSAGELLRALSAPVRMAIVLQLQVHDCCVHDLVDTMELPQPLVSQHLRVLKAAGVVIGERDGREVRYHLVDHHLAHIVVDAITHARECLSGELPGGGADAPAGGADS